MINGKAFSALKYILAVVAILTMGLSKPNYYDSIFSFQVIWARKPILEIQKIPW